VANLSLALNYYFNGYNIVGSLHQSPDSHHQWFLLYALARASQPSDGRLQRKRLGRFRAVVGWFTRYLSPWPTSSNA
jgi:hypothetical protein